MASKFNASPGDHVYKYTLSSKIGGDNFGEVWLAHDLALDQDFAIKLLDASKTSIADELREAHIGHRMDHENLVKVHGADIVAFNNKDVVILTMDYLPRGSVASLVNSRGFVSLDEAVKIAIDTLRGLEYLHGLDMIHNDIKPKNVLVGDNGEGKLTDYGISAQSQNGQSVAAPMSYVLHEAPEVIASGNINAQTDVYQVGMTLLRLLNGIGILRAKRNSLGDVAFLEAAAKGKLIANSDFAPFVPRSLVRVVKTAIHHDPAKRFKSALEMRRALEKLVYNGSWSTDPIGAPVGQDSKYEYRFEVNPKGPNVFNLTALKKSKASGRETKIGAFTKKNLSEAEKDSLLKSFLVKVVEG